MKEEITEGGFDMMIMRELTGGLYFGERKTEEIDGVMTAKDSLTYNEEEIRRIAKRGFDIAMKRRKKVTSVDKANVLEFFKIMEKSGRRSCKRLSRGGSGKYAGRQLCNAACKRPKTV